MPCYDFRCEECEREVEYALPIKDRNEPVNWSCKYCNSKSLKRMYTVIDSFDNDLLKADRRMEDSGVQSAIERIRDNHPKAQMRWN